MLETLTTVPVGRAGFRKLLKIIAGSLLSPDFARVDSGSMHAVNDTLLDRFDTLLRLLPPSPKLSWANVLVHFVDVEISAPGELATKKKKKKKKKKKEKNKKERMEAEKGEKVVKGEKEEKWRI